MLPIDKITPTSQVTWKPTKNRRPSPEAKDRPSRKKQAKPAPETGIINGRPAGSSYEWNVAKALWKLGWEFSYQVPVMGGSQIRGGQVLDFLVHTVPLQTAVIVNGDYWHQTDQEYKNDQLMSALFREGHSVNNVPVVLWRAQAQTYEAALAFLNTKLGKG